MCAFAWSQARDPSAILCYWNRSWLPPNLCSSALLSSSTPSTLALPSTPHSPGGTGELHSQVMPGLGAHHLCPKDHKNGYFGRTPSTQNATSMHRASCGTSPTSRNTAREAQILLSYHLHQAQVLHIPPEIQGKHVAISDCVPWEIHLDVFSASEEFLIFKFTHNLLENHHQKLIRIKIKWKFQFCTKRTRTVLK